MAQIQGEQTARLLRTLRHWSAHYRGNPHINVGKFSKRYDRLDRCLLSGFHRSLRSQVAGDGDVSVAASSSAFLTTLWRYDPLVEDMCSNGHAENRFTEVIKLLLCIASSVLFSFDLMIAIAGLTPGSVAVQPLSLPTHSLRRWIPPSIFLPTSFLQKCLLSTRRLQRARSRV